MSRQRSVTFIKDIHIAKVFVHTKINTMRCADKSKRRVSMNDNYKNHRMVRQWPILCVLFIFMASRNIDVRPNVWKDKKKRREEVDEPRAKRTGQTYFQCL